MKVITLDNLRLFKTLIMSQLNNPDSENYPNNEWLQMVYPVGAIYLSTSDINPLGLFGFGTWERIKDTFLLCAGDTYASGSTGGEAEHTLTVDEMPSHTHTYKRHAFDRNDSDPTTGEDVYGANNKTLAAHEGTTESTGGGGAHNNMPPYLAVYAWKRVA